MIFLFIFVLSLCAQNTTESEYFVFHLAPRDMVLEDMAKETLEACKKQAQDILGLEYKKKTPVEIYGGVHSFSENTLLEEELIKRGGIVGLAKYDRVMILTPEALPLGYAWRDTLCHEYLHHLLKNKVGERLPLWFQEGFARHWETIWRTTDTFASMPGDKEELLLAAREGRLISFAQMEPSLVYLKNSGEIGLAFSEVAEALEVMKPKTRAFLKELSRDGNFKKDFERAYGKKLEDFEKELFASWKRQSQDKNFKATGALRSAVVFGDQKRLEELALGPSVMQLISLGDKLRERGDLVGAQALYNNALKEEPNNPYLLSRLAKIALSLGDARGAGSLAQALVRQNPQWAPGYQLEGEIDERENQYQKAIEAYKNYLTYNPYHLELYKRIVFIYVDLGETAKAKPFLEKALILSPQDPDLLKTKEAIGAK